MGLRKVIAAVAVLLLGVGPAAAAPRDAVMNQEGYWGIDVDGGFCVASMTLQGGAIFLLRAGPDGLTPALFSKTPLKAGKTLRLQTDARAIDLPASFSDKRTAVYVDGVLADDAVAALRASRQLRLLVDEHTIVVMTLEGTGFADVAQSVADCAAGKRGWWGEGVRKVTKAPPEPPLNKEGVWSLSANETDRGVCSALAQVEGGLGFVLVAVDGALGFGVGSEKPFKRGRKAVFETDTYRFEFRPDYDGADYFSGGEFLDSQAIITLRRAKQVRITVEGREVFSMVLEGSGHAEVLTGVVACSRGEKGWWGEGAKQR